MRVVIAMMKHETNTFSPVPTPIERFARGYPLPPRGEEALNIVSAFQLKQTWLTLLNHRFPTKKKARRGF